MDRPQQHRKISPKLLRAWVCLPPNPPVRDPLPASQWTNTLKMPSASLPSFCSRPTPSLQSNKYSGDQCLLPPLPTPVFEIHSLPPNEQILWGSMPSASSQTPCSGPTPSLPMSKYPEDHCCLPPSQPPSSRPTPNTQTNKYSEDQCLPPPPPSPSPSPSLLPP